MMYWALYGVTSVCAILVGVIATSWYHQRNESKLIKLLVFRQLMGTRFCLLDDVNDVDVNNRFSEAINQAFVVFHDSEDVKKALKEFHALIVDQQGSSHQRNESLLELLKAMSKNLRIDTTAFSDSFLLKPMYVRCHGQSTRQI